MSATADPFAVLAQLKKEHKTWKAVADKLGYSQPYLCDVIYRRRAVTDKLLERLGLVQVRKIVRAK